MHKIFFLLFVFPLHVSAFTLIHNPVPKYPSAEITVNATGDDCSAIGHTAESFLDYVIDVSDEFWNSIPSSAIHLKRGSVISATFNDVTTTNTSSQALAKVPDGTILVGCNSSSFSSNTTLGHGYISVPGSGSTRGFFMVNVSGNYTSSSEGQKRAAIAHELGHAIGIGHSSDEGALMYYSLSGKLQERLAMDDHDAAAYLYPHDGPPGSCGTISSNQGNSKRMLFSFIFLMMLFLAFKNHAISYWPHR